MKSQSMLFFGLSLSAAVIALAVPYLLSQAWLMPGLLLAVGGLWAAASLRGGRIGGIAFPLLAAAAVVSLLNHFPPLSGIIGITAALIAWELEHFIWQTRGQPDDAILNNLVKSHLRMLGMVSGIGLILGILATLPRLSLGFWPLGIVLLGSLFLLRAAIRAFNQEKTHDE